MRVLLSSLSAILALVVFAGPAHAVITIQITKGDARALPIAVVPFGAPEGTAPLPVDIAAVISADLASSGRFNPMEPANMPSRPTEFSEVNFKDWRLVEMDNLVVGRVTPGAAGDYVVEFRLVDVYKGAQSVGYRIPSTAADLRFTAHQIADIIYEQLTNQKGAFATRIAYVTVENDGQGGKVYALQLADADGYNPQTLLRSPQPLLSPAWAPDGRRIAYVSFEGRNSAIYVQEVATGNRQEVAAGPGLNSAPAWSPDGTRLAMTLSKDGNPEIYIMNLSTRALTRLTNNPAIDTEASWSPDGSRIAFTSDRGGGPQIYEVGVGGGEAKRVTFGKGEYNARPRYSPDGRKIALVTRSNGAYRIGVLDLDTDTLTVLTDSRLDESPTFAPNGQMVMYSTVGRSGTELAAVSVDGRIRQRLALQEGEVREPAWGPLGR